MFTVRNEVAKVMFLQVSVILLTGGGVGGAWSWWGGCLVPGGAWSWGGAWSRGGAWSWGLVSQHSPPPRETRPLLQTVCILLECILVVVVLSMVAAAKPDFFSNFYIYMSHFAYACKMQCPLNLVLENSEYLWFYWTFCIVILDCGLKLHKLSNHTLVMLQKWLEIH